MMINEFVYHGKQKLRCGYTTGSCAAAAAKASAEMLLSGTAVKKIGIDTPKGIRLDLDVQNSFVCNEYASCGIVKDSGDDPDITNGMLICAKAERSAEGIEILGGEGIGTVTKEGLDQPVGAAAINSVPRRMIRLAVSEICEKYDYRGGLRITVSAPQGRDIAVKTFNERIGVIGGISIIGTTGIVEPMSNSAIIETVRTEEKMRRAEGRNNLLLTIGNYSEDFIAERLPFMSRYSVICSNFIGEAIDAALEFGFESVLIIGHIGKMVKLGAGIMNTHSAQADGRMEVLVTCGVLAGADMQTLKKVTECVTVDAALALFEADGVLPQVERILMERIQFYLEAKVKREVLIGAAAFSYKYGIIGKTAAADNIIKLLTEEYHG